MTLKESDSEVPVRIPSIGRINMFKIICIRPLRKKALMKQQQKMYIWMWFLTSRSGVGKLQPAALFYVAPKK